MRRADRILLGACFFLSGATGLVLEVAWSKELTYVLGNTLYAVSTVVAAFMGGLGLGSILAGHRAHRFSSPIRTYALLEAGIGFFGIVLLPIFRSTPPLFAAIYAGLSGGPFLLVRFLVVFVLLLLPTTLMGMTLPVLVGALARQKRTFEREAGLVYGINTVGAVVGTLAAGFLLVPGLGLWRTCLLAGLADFSLASVAFFLAHRVGSIRGIPEREQAPGWTAAQWRIAALYGLSGLIALVYEVAWFRLLGLTMGPSVYAFTAMLGVYLVGIGLGSALAAPWSGKRLLGGLGALVLLEAVLGLITLLQLHAVNGLPETYSRIFGWAAARFGESGFSVSLTLLSGLVVFLPCLVLGTMFPVVVRAVGEAGRGISPEGHVGRIYLLNTAGSIAGSLLTGFVLLPRLGLATTLIAAGCGSLILAGMFGLLQSGPVARRGGFLAGFLALAAFLAHTTPHWDARAFNLGLYRDAYAARASSGPRRDEMIYHREGLLAPVAVYRTSGNATLYVSGKPDASLSSSDLATQLLTGHLPVTLSENPRDVAVIGYGSGITAAAVLTHPAVEKLDLIEIEQAVIDAAPFFESVAGNPLRDPRTRLVLEDARIFLSHTRNLYDVIASEPSNPWMAGMSNLFTSDYYRIVRRHLRPGGVYAQWIQDYDVSESSFGVILASLADHFPHVMLFRPTPGDIIAIASAEPIAVPWEQVRSALAHPVVARSLSRIRITDPLEIGFFFQGPAATVEQFLRGRGTRNTDDNAWLEYRMPRELMRGVSGPAEGNLGLKLARLGAPVRLGELERLWPGLPTTEAVRAMTLFPHRQEPDVGGARVSADVWWEIRDALRQGLAAELARRGDAALAARLEQWDREGNAYRQMRENVTSTLREISRGQREADPATLARAVQQAPDLASARLFLGQYLLFAGEQAAALREFQLAANDPTSPARREAILAMARMAVDVDEPDEAARLCEEAIAWNPYYPDAFSMLATVRKAAGDSAGAVRDARRGLVYNPQDDELRKLAR